MTEIFSDELDALLNLLAVIHRDGGHYRSEHGLRMAISHAEDIILSDRAENERLEARLGEILKMANDKNLHDATVRSNIFRLLLPPTGVGE